MIVPDFPTPVTTLSAFYNRQHEFQRALAVLTACTRTPVVVIGERRMGKTSLQNVVVEALQTIDPPLVALYVEPRVITSVDLFAEAIFRQLSMHLESDFHALGLLGSDEHFQFEAPDQFDQVVLSIIPPNHNGDFVLCIDEFDEIVRLISNAGEDEKMRFFALIHHLVERSPLPLRLFFTITHLPTSMKSELPSPLISKAEVIELLPLTEPTTLGMLDWLLKDIQEMVEPAVKQRIVELAGGHPYFLKLLVSNLTGVGQEDTALIRDLAAFERIALPAALEDLRARHAIANVYKIHFDSNEKRVLLYMAVRAEPVDIEELHLAGREVVRAVRSLINRHYLREKAGKMVSQVQFLDYWFRNWAMFDEELERLNIYHIAGLGMNDPALSKAEKESK